MNNEAFVGGFIKAAINKGFDADAIKKLLISTAPGGLAGAGIGGLGGYMSGMDEDPEKDHSMRNAILGALGGYGAGAGGQALLENYLKDKPDAASFPDFNLDNAREITEQPLSDTPGLSYDLNSDSTKPWNENLGMRYNLQQQPNMVEQIRMNPSQVKDLADLFSNLPEGIKPTNETPMSWSLMDTLKPLPPKVDKSAPLDMTGFDPGMTPDQYKNYLQANSSKAKGEYDVPLESLKAKPFGITPINPGAGGDVPKTISRQMPEPKGKTLDMTGMF